MKKDEVDMQWHGPFVAAVWLELKGNKYDLEYQKEYNLNTMPLRIDLIVMLKPGGKKIENKIGEIFRKYNLMEYKSPRDKLNVETFFKVIAYACLLRALPQTIGQIDEEQITISLIREGYPRELMKYLKNKGFKITKKYDGIYYVEKVGVFPIQVIDTRKLNHKEHVWLTALTRKMNMQQAKTFYDALVELQDEEEIEYSKAIVDLSMKINPRLFYMMREEDPMRYAGFEKVYKAELAEIKKQGISEGISQGREEGKVETKLMDIEGIINTLHVTLEAACNAVGITMNEYMGMKEQSVQRSA